MVLVLAVALGIAMAIPLPAEAGRVPVDRAAPDTAITAEPVGASTGALAYQDKRRYRAAIRYATNVKRRDNGGLVQLRGRTCLHYQAKRSANHLAATGRFAHSDLRATLDRCNLRGVSENLARGYVHAPSAVNGWMASSGHRANILNSRNRLIGVGVANGPRGWVTVQLMGY